MIYVQEFFITALPIIREKWKQFKFQTGDWFNNYSNINIRIYHSNFMYTYVWKDKNQDINCDHIYRIGSQLVVIFLCAFVYFAHFLP